MGTWTLRALVVLRIYCLLGRVELGTLSELWNNVPRRGLMKHIIGRGLGFRDSGPCKGLMKHILSRPMGVYKKKRPPNPSSR